MGGEGTMHAALNSFEEEQDKHLLTCKDIVERWKDYPYIIGGPGDLQCISVSYVI